MPPGASLRKTCFVFRLKIGELDQANISNISVIEDANLPVKPEGPNRLMLLAAGFVMALLAGAHHSQPSVSDPSTGYVRRV